MTAEISCFPSSHARKKERIVFAVAGLARVTWSRLELRTSTHDGLALKKALTTALSAAAGPWRLASRRRWRRSSPSKWSPIARCTGAAGAGCSAEWLPTCMRWPAAVARDARLCRRRGNTRRCERGPQLLLVRADVRSELADRRIPHGQHHCHVPDAWRMKNRPGSRSSTGNCALQLSMHVPVARSEDRAPCAFEHFFFAQCCLPPL